MSVFFVKNTCMTFYCFDRLHIVECFSVALESMCLCKQPIFFFMVSIWYKKAGLWKKKPDSLPVGSNK